MPGIDCSIVIDAGPARVFAAFFDPQALQEWWEVRRSVTTPRMLGVFALEWETADVSDPVLGPLGGVLHGTVLDVRPSQSFFVADAYWIPPDGDPIGPMALDVTLTLSGASTVVRYQQTGCDDSPRWHRYYAVVEAGIAASLGRLKAYVEAA